MLVGARITHSGNRVFNKTNGGKRSNCFIHDGSYVLHKFHGHAFFRQI